MDDRREDWKHGVDENLASLNAGQRVWEHEQKIIRKVQDEQDGLLRGDPDKETDGLIARVHSMETEVRLLRAVLFKDAAGHGGLIEDVKELRGGREDRRLGWGNITKVLVAIITSGAIGLFWNDIRAQFLKKSKDPMDLMIDRALHPKPKRRHVIIRELPEETTED